MKKHSILTDYDDISAFSGKPREAIHHCIFGVGVRELADEDRIWLPLTNWEHNLSPMGTINQIHGNPAAEKLSKMLGQVAYEKEYIAKRYVELSGETLEDIKRESRNAFMERYGKSYL